MHKLKERKMKLEKGRVPVQVGLENGPFQRFVIPISYLKNPYFQRLLDRAGEFYGYQTSGLLMIPSSVEDFLHLERCIEKVANKQKRHHCHQLVSALSYYAG
ncbi:unnamed protein product [Fraxinus pennsylvanica]|uniref:Small auxin up regulated protein n=1 Tax=Fraxinus pennsylvanica TaxID=56036 RepID=A0AAD1YL43_9LAMI|nr:unnamed protein product [Fraxinus pennsylvanica]